MVAPERSQTEKRGAFQNAQKKLGFSFFFFLIISFRGAGESCSIQLAWRGTDPKAGVKGWEGGGCSGTRSPLQTVQTKEDGLL